MQRLVDEVREGSVRAAGRLISLLEDDPARLPEMLRGAAHWPQPEFVVGVTGAPGVGKSTVVDALVTEWRRAQPDWLIGVIAVDPSSVFTGGAILGDRIRMMDHATDPMVFIRSLANRGHLGGLTLGIRGTLRVMGLLGCRVILVETVGVGQSEIEVSEVADVVVVLLAPGLGDSIQMIKAGVLETGDILVVNKADREGADRVYAELTSVLKFTNPRHWGLVPAVCKIAAVQGTGVRELRETIEDRCLQLHERLAKRRETVLQEEVRQAILEAALQRIEGALTRDGRWESDVDRLLGGQVNVSELAEELLRRAARHDPGKTPKAENHDS